MTQSKPSLIFYTKRNCPLCEQAKTILGILTEKYQLSFREVDIYDDEELLEKYQIIIPVLEIEGEITAYGKFSISTLDGVFKKLIV